MPDWSAYVRARLHIPGLREEREAEIVEDLARQLDDAYRDAMKTGAMESDARARAEQHIADWDALARQLSASPRQRQSPIERWQQQADDRTIETRGGFTQLSRLCQDVLYGVRMLRRSPAVTAMAALSLALGIGANTAIFSVIHALMFRPLPVPHAEQLVMVSEPASAGFMTGVETGERTLFSYREFQEMRDRNDVLDGLMAFSSQAMNAPVTTSDGLDSRQALVTLAGGTYFRTLGVEAAIGRTFGPEVEPALLAHPVAVVSDAFWRIRLQQDPSLASRTVRIRQTVFQVIGVLPATFTGIIVGEAPDIWIPLTMQQAAFPGRDWLTQPPGTVRRSMFLHVVGRLKPGVSLEQADAGMKAVFTQALETEASTIPDAARRGLLDAHVLVKDARYGVSPLRGEYRQPLGALMALVGLLLLLACANVANLLLARATGRQRELAVRVAMGAGRGRLIRQLLTESVMLAGASAVMGLGFAMLGVRVLLRLVSEDRTPVPLDARLDPNVLAFTVGVAVFTGLLFGLAPALQATRVDLNTVFRGTSPNVAGAGRRWSLGKVLAAAQVAISLMLLICAGLFVRTLQNLATVPLGYDARSMLLFQVAPTASGYAPAAVLPLFETLTTKFAALPGVQNVSLSDHGVLDGNDSSTEVTFARYTPADGLEMNVNLDRIGPRFFSTLGIPVLVGRDVEPQDATGVIPCWINRTMTRHFFREESPVGRRMTMHFTFGDTACEIRGVVADARTRSISAPMERRVYVPYFGPITRNPMAIFVLRTSGEPMALAAGVRRVLRETDASLEPPTFRTVPELIDRRLAEQRMTAQLSSVFGGLALLLASMGLYGVLAYAVTRRVTEIGVRMALGAPRGRILGLVMKDAMVMTIVGAVVGIGGALAATRLMDTMLFGLSPRDAGTIAGALGVLLSVALLAAALPAWRASRTDPLRALRDGT